MEAMIPSAVGSLESFDSAEAQPVPAAARSGIGFWKIVLGVLAGNLLTVAVIYALAAAFPGVFYTLTH